MTETTIENGGGTPEQKRRRRSAPHPTYPMRECEELARRTFELGARHVDQERLATALSYSGVKNGSYKSRRAAASQFDMVKYDGFSYIEVVPPWVTAFHEEDPEQLATARRAAFLAPDLYRQLFEEFEGKMVPSVDRLARHLFLHERFGITQEAADAAAAGFVESADYAGYLDQNGFLRTPNDTTDPKSGPGADDELAGAGAPVGPPPADAGDLIAGENDRLEIRLGGGRKVHLIVPAPGTLSTVEKDRVKGFVDLILAPEETNE